MAGAGFKTSGERKQQDLMSRPARRSTQIGVTQRLQYATKNVIHHRGGELPGIGVLPARMVATDQDLPVRQLMLDVVAERRPRAERHPAPGEEPQVGVERDFPED